MPLHNFFRNFGQPFDPPEGDASNPPFSRYLVQEDSLGNPLHTLTDDRFVLVLLLRKTPP